MLTVKNSITDVAGNALVETTNTLAVDTANPTVVIAENNADGTVSDGDPTVTYTLNFSEGVEDLEIGDLNITGGAFVNNSLTKVSATQWTVQATATDGSVADLVLTVKNSITDVAGNALVQATNTLAVDTANPNSGTLSFNQGNTVAQNGIATNNGTFTLSIGGQEAGAGVQFERSADAGVTWTNVIADQTGLVGSYRFRAQVTDPAGNVSTTGLLVVIVGTTAPASDLKAIDQLLGASVFDATALTKITGSAIDIVDVLNSTGITKDGKVALEVTAGTATLAQVNTMDAATSGVLTATVTEQNLAALATLADSANNALTITVADTTQAAETLNTLNGKTTLQVDATAATTLTGTAADLKTALNLVGLRFAGNVAVTVAADVVPAADLSSIDAKTTGVVNAVTVPELTGTAAEVRAVADASPAAIQLAAAFMATINDAITIAQLAAIDEKTTGVITHPSFADTAANLAAQAQAGGYLTTGNKPVSISDDHTLAQLRAINNATTGTVTLFNKGIALNGPAAAVSEGLTGFADYEGSVTLTDNHTLAQLKVINAATSGTISLGNKNVALTGTAADVAAALDGISDYTGNVTLQSNHDLAQLKAINNATTGAITLPNAGVALNGSAADLSAALAGITTYTGDITVTGSATLAQLAAIDASTSGALTYTNIIDSAANLAANTDGYLMGDKNVTVTNNHNTAQLKAINDATTGTITLANKAIALSGSATDIAAALTGFTDYTGNVEITGTATVAQLKAIDAATFGTLAYGTVADSAANLAFNDGGYVKNGKNVILTDNHTLDQLKAINNATDGTITLASASVALNGPAEDLLAALNGIAVYSGAVTVTGTPTLKQLADIDALTSGVLAYTSVRDTAAILSANAGGYVMNGVDVTLSDAHTLEQLKTINNATNGAITLADNSVALSGSVTDVLASLSGFAANTYNGVITLTGAPAATLAQLKTLDDVNQANLVYTAAGISDTEANISLNAANLSGNAATYITGTVPVTITGSPSLAKLTAVRNATTGALTYTAITDTSANLVADTNNAAGLIKDGTNVTVNGSALVADLAAIDAKNGNGSLTYANITDSIGNLLVDNTYRTKAGVTYTFNDAAGEVPGFVTVASGEVIRAATNGQLKTDGTNFDYRFKVDDSLVNIAAKATFVNANAVSYSLSNNNGALGNLTATQAAVVRAATDRVDYTYALVDTTAIVNAATADVLKSSSAITVNDNADVVGSTLDLKKVDAIGANVPVTITGDAGQNIVQLSAALTASKQVAVGLGGLDTTIDTVIFNAAANAYTQNDLLAFNKLNGFSIVNGQTGLPEDRIAFYAVDKNAYSRFVSTSTIASRQLREGTVFEDDDLGLITAGQAADVSYIRDQVAGFVAAAGSQAASNSIGRANGVDFLYIAYGETTGNLDSVSAYVYGGYFDQPTAVTAGSLTDAAAKEKIYIVSLAEIVDIAIGDLQAGNFTSSKSGLS